MTTLHKAAQQALEALEMYATETDSEFQRKAITALRAALAQQQAEPVREPVPAAVVATQSDVWHGYNGQWQAPGGAIKMVQVLRDLPTGTLLYIAPPQRKPLTEDDLRKLADKHLFYQLESYEASGVFALSRAVERAHGIGEQP